MLICTFYIAILVPYNFAFDEDEAENVFQLFYSQRSLCAPPLLAAAHADVASPRAALNESLGANATTAAAAAGVGAARVAAVAGSSERWHGPKNFEVLRVLDVAVEGLFICGARARVSEQQAARTVLYCTVRVAVSGRLAGRQTVSCGRADILLNFRTTFVSKGGHVIYDGRAIALNYLRGWFTLDLIAALPLEILSFVRNGYLVRATARTTALSAPSSPPPPPPPPPRRRVARSPAPLTGWDEIVAVPVSPPRLTFDRAIGQPARWPAGRSARAEPNYRRHGAARL